MATFDELKAAVQAPEAPPAPTEETLSPLAQRIQRQQQEKERSDALMKAATERPPAPKPAPARGKKPARPPGPTVTGLAKEVKKAEEEIAAPPKLVLPPDLSRVIDYETMYRAASTPSYKLALQRAARDAGMSESDYRRVAEAQGVSLEGIYNARAKGRSYSEVAQANRERGVLGFTPVDQRLDLLQQTANRIGLAQAGIADDKIDLVKSRADYAIQGTSTELPEVSKPGEYGYTTAELLVNALKRDKEASQIYDLYGRQLSTGSTQKYVEARVKDLIKRARLGPTQGSEETLAKFRRRAINEVLAYKTIGQWSPAITMRDVDVTEGRESPSFFEAMTPNVELIGINNKGQAVFRQESPLGVLLRAIDIPQAALVGALEGSAAKGIQTGANFLEYSLDHTEGASPYVRAPLVLGGLAASIAFPDLLLAGGKAKGVAKAGYDVYKVRKYAPKAIELLETVASARAAKDFARAQTAERELRQIMPVVADALDRYDAITATKFRLMDPASDILNEDMTAILAALSTDTGEFAASRSWLHPSLRKDVLSVKGPTKDVPFTAYDELFDTNRLLARVRDAKKNFVDNAPKTVEEFFAKFSRGATRDVLADFRLPAAQADELAQIVEGLAPVALRDVNQFRADLRAALKAHPEFGKDEYNLIRQAMYVPGRTRLSEQLARKAAELAGKDINDALAPALSLFDRATKAIEDNNEARGIGASLLRDELARQGKLRVQPLNLFDDVAPVGPNGEAIRLTPGGVLFLHRLRRAFPKGDFKEMLAQVTILDRMVVGKAMRDKLDPYDVYAALFPEIRKATPEDIKKYIGKAPVGTPPAPPPKQPAPPAPPAPPTPPTPPAPPTPPVPPVAPPVPPKVPTPPVPPTGPIDTAVRAKDPLLAFLEDLAPANGTMPLKDALLAFAKETKDPFHARLAERLADLGGRMDQATFRVVRKGEATPTDPDAARLLNKNALGLTYTPYSPKRAITVYLRGSSIGGFSAEGASVTFLHEAVHAAAVDRFTVGQSAAKGTALRAAADELASLKRAVRTRLNKARKTGAQAPLFNRSDKTLFKDVDEFIAYGMTEPGFQAWLKTVKMSPKSPKSLWSLFTDTIAKLLGLPPKDNSALARLIDVTDRLLAVPVADVEAARAGALTPDVIRVSAQSAAEAIEEAPEVSRSVWRDAQRVDIDRARRSRIADVMISRLTGVDIAHEYEDIPEAFRVGAQKRLRQASEGLQAGKITEQEYFKLVTAVADDLDDQAQIRRARALQGPKRGTDWVRSRLLAARADGRLDDAGVELADWFLQQNPRIAGELAISIRKGGEDALTAGFYERASQLVVLIKDKGDELTATHEILHHTERMLPEAMQDAIRKEWRKQLTATLKTATPEQRTFLEKMLTGVDYNDVAEAFASGKLPIQYYQFLNPSEFWAVHASEIVAGRFAAFNKGLATKAKQWLVEFVQKVKSVFGLKSDAAIIRGLDEVLAGNGTFVSKETLGARGKYLSVEPPQPSGNLEAAARQTYEEGVAFAVAEFNKLRAEYSPAGAAVRVRDTLGKYKKAELTPYQQGVLDWLAGKPAAKRAAKQLESAESGVLKSISPTPPQEPTQIKSATANVGTFSPEDPNILRQPTMLWTPGQPTKSLRDIDTDALIQDAEDFRARQPVKDPQPPAAPSELPERRAFDARHDTRGPVGWWMPLPETERALGDMAEEHVVFFDSQGRQIGRNGPEDTRALNRPDIDPSTACVVYPDELAEAAKDGAAVYTHNHPSGSVPSIEDVLTAARGNFAELRAVADGDGFSWVVRRPEAGWPSYQTMKDSWDSVAREAGDIASAAMDQIVRNAGGDPRMGPYAKGYDQRLWRRLYGQAVTKVLETPVGVRFQEATGLLYERVPHSSPVGLGAGVRKAVLPAGAGPAAAEALPDVVRSPGAAYRAAEAAEAAVSSLRQVSPTGAVKGVTETMADGRHVIILFEQADVSTVIHEVAHVIRRTTLDAEDMDKITTWVRRMGVNVDHEFGEFTGTQLEVERAEEMFAKAFEQYVMEGKAPVPFLQGVFDHLKNTMLQIYRGVRDPVLGVNLQPEVRQVFDKLLADAPEQGMPTLKQVMHREILGAKDDDIGFLERLANEAKRKGIPNSTPEDLQKKFDLANTRARETIDQLKEKFWADRKLAKTDRDVIALEAKLNADIEKTKSAVYLSFPSKVLGKKDWTFNDIAEAEAAMREVAARSNLDRAALKINIGDITGKRGAVFEEDTAVESLRSVLAEPENPKTPPSKTRALLRGTMATFFGGDVIGDKGMRFMPPEMRNAIMTAERVIDEAIGGTISLLNDALKTGERNELFRFLSGESNVRRLSGRPILAPVHDYMGSVRGMIMRAIANMSDEEQEALRMLAGAVNLPTEKAYTEALKTLGFQASGALEPSLSFAVGDEMRAAVQKAAVSAINKLLYAQGKAAEKDFGSSLAKALRTSISAPEVPRPNTELKFVELLTYLGGLTTREVGGKPKLFRGTSRDAVELLVDGTAKLYDDQAARRVAVVVGGFGSASIAKQSLVDMGLGISEEAKRAFANWIAGEQWPPEYTEEIQRIIDRYGYNPSFIKDAVLDSDFYIPQLARERMADALVRATYRPPSQAGGAEDAINVAFRFMKTRMTRGNFFIRQRYYMMNTVDHFIQLGMTAGFGVAANSVTRVIAQDLMVLPFWQQLVDALHKMPGAERARGLPVVGAAFERDALERARRNLQKYGDIFGSRVGQLFSVSKYRIEVNPILEGLDGGFRAGNKVYSYREIRNIAVQEGIFASFDTRQLSNAILREGTLSVNYQLRELGQLADTTMQLSAASKKGKILNFFADWQETVSNTAEAWGERERLGAMVALMEAGHDPRTAARLTIDALYDYSQSMTKADRSLLVGIMFPFWAFQKNANAQVFNNLFSPWGAYRMMCIRRARERGTDLLTEVLYNEVAGEYGIDVESMPPELQDTYYSIVTAFENAYEGEPPEEARRALRMLFAGRARDIEEGRLVELSPDLMMLRQSGAFAKVGEFAQYVVMRPSKANRPTWLRDRTGIAVPFPKTEAVRMYYRLLGDDHSYMELFIPESTIEAGLRHHTQLMASYLLLGSAPLDFLSGGKLTEAGLSEVKLTRVLAPVADPSRSPLIGPLLADASSDFVPPKKIALDLSKPTAALTKVHPMVGKMLDDMFGTAFLRVPAISDPFVVNPETGRLEVSEEEVRRIRELQKEYPNVGVLREERYYIPGGVWSTAFENSPLGELNALLLKWEENPAEQADVRGEILQWARAFAGLDVEQITPSKVIRTEEPTKMKETKGM